MTISPFSGNIERLKKDALSFEMAAASIMGPVQSKKITVEAVEGSHKRIMAVYTKTLEEIASLKIEIQDKTTPANEETMLFDVITVTDIEGKLEKALNRLNDSLLTFCPTAKIEYGKSCIGPKKAPLLETTDSGMKKLLSTCTSIREIRGDGNCFASAFTTKYLETLIEENAFGKFITILTKDKIKEPLLKKEMVSTINDLRSNPAHKEVILGDNKKILPFINYFRVLAADEMKKNSDQFEAFFRSDIEDVFGGTSEGKSYERLIADYVLKMGVDFSQPSITALCQRLQFPVRIIDPKLGASDGINILDTAPPKATFCRNGSHYFVLYQDKEAPIAPMPVEPIIPSAEAPKKPTEIVIKCKVPFGHNLFIRGSGSGLSWDQGIPLIQIDEDTWIFRSSTPLDDIEYKFLFDDKIWENESNHKIASGKLDGINPIFSLPADLETHDKLTAPATRITVQFSGPAEEKLFIRGTGPGMSWETGIELKSLGNGIWIFETQAEFTGFEYKILLADKIWEQDPNHKVEFGKKESIILKL